MLPAKLFIYYFASILLLSCLLEGKTLKNDNCTKSCIFEEKVCVKSKIFFNPNFIVCQCQGQDHHLVQWGAWHFQSLLGCFGTLLNSFLLYIFYSERQVLASSVNAMIAMDTLYRILYTLVIQWRSYNLTSRRGLLAGLGITRDQDCFALLTCVNLFSQGSIYYSSATCFIRYLYVRSSQSPGKQEVIKRDSFIIKVWQERSSVGSATIVTTNPCSKASHPLKIHVDVKSQFHH